MYANINESFKNILSAALVGLGSASYKKNVMERSRQTLKDCFANAGREGETNLIFFTSLLFPPCHFQPSKTPWVRTLKSELKLLFEVAVASVVSPTLASGSLQEKQFISSTAQGHK